MAYPPKYDRQHSFSDWQEEHPSSPLPADWVEDELNTAKLSIDSTIDSLKQIQRSDGALGNRTVGFDQLKPEIRTGVRQPYPWATNTAYAQNDAVSYENSMYVCAVAHTSSTSFYDDLFAGKWTLVLNLEAATMSSAALSLTRADIPSRVIPYQSIVVSGHTTKSDLGAGALYVRGTSTGPMAIKDGAGTWFQLAIPGFAERAWFGGAGSTNTVAAISALESVGGGVLRFAPGADDDPANALTGTWPQYPNTLLDYTGRIPFSSYHDDPQADETNFAQFARRAQDAGSHTDGKRTVEYLEYRPKGSGTNGPWAADYARTTSIIKHDWGTTTEAGEIDAEVTVLRTGGPDGTNAASARSDAAAWLADVQNIGDSGFLAVFEAVSSNISRADYSYVRNIGVQCGVINSATDLHESYGYVATAKNGSNTAAYLAQAEVAGTWESYFRAKAYGGTTRFDISDTTAIINPSGWITNGSVNIAKVSNGYFQYYRKPRSVAGTFGPDVTSDLSRTLLAVGGSAVTMILQKTNPVGWWCDVVLYESGAGPVTFSPETGATLIAKSSHTKLSALNGRVRLEVVANAGNAAVWLLSGDTSA